MADQVDHVRESWQRADNINFATVTQCNTAGSSGVSSSPYSIIFSLYISVYQQALATAVQYCTVCMKLVSFVIQWLCSSVHGSLEGGWKLTDLLHTCSLSGVPGGHVGHRKSFSWWQCLMVIHGPPYHRSWAWITANSYHLQYYWNQLCPSPPPPLRSYMTTVLVSALLLAFKFSGTLGTRPWEPTYGFIGGCRVLPEAMEVQRRQELGALTVSQNQRILKDSGVDHRITVSLALLTEKLVHSSDTSQAVQCKCSVDRCIRPRAAASYALWTWPQNIRSVSWGT